MLQLYTSSCFVCQPEFYLSSATASRLTCLLNIIKIIINERTKVSVFFISQLKNVSLLVHLGMIVASIMEKKNKKKTST